MNVDILSFGRLAYHVFDELGVSGQVVLEDTGKSMILRKVLSLKNDELIFLVRKQVRLALLMNYNL